MASLRRPMGSLFPLDCQINYVVTLVINRFLGSLSWTHSASAASGVQPLTNLNLKQIIVIYTFKLEGYQITIVSSRNIFQIHLHQCITYINIDRNALYSSFSSTCRSTQAPRHLQPGHPSCQPGDVPRIHLQDVHDLCDQITTQCEKWTLTCLT